MKLLKKDLMDNKLNENRFKDLVMNPNLRFNFKNKTLLIENVLKVEYDKFLELLVVIHLENKQKTPKYIDLDKIESIHQL